MGLFEKNRFRKLLNYIEDWKMEDPKTHNKIDPKAPFKEVIKKFDLEPNTANFVGHAVALYTTD